MSKETLAGTQLLTQQGQLGHLMRALFPEASELRAYDINERISERLREKDVLQAAREATKDHYPVRSRTTLNISRIYIPEAVSSVLERTTLIAVGAGLSSIIPLLYFRDLGVPDRNITMADLTGYSGGMWTNNPHAKEIKWNNPHTTIQWDELDPSRGRTGQTMQNYIQYRLANRFHKPVVRGEVVKLQSTPLGQVGVLKAPGAIGPAESAIVSLGNEPTSLATTKMASNAEVFKEEIERSQRPFTEVEARQLDGKAVLIVGLGNSALAQIRFIEEANQTYGINITPVILTHFTREGILDPNSYHVRADGTRDRLSRDLNDGRTINLELDLPDSDELFLRIRNRSQLFQAIDKRALAHVGISGIVPSVTSWNIVRREDRYTIKFEISPTHDRQYGGSHTIENVGKIFVLGGYTVNPERLHAMGVNTDSSGKAIVRPQDGVVLRSDGTPDPSKYLTGFAAADKIYDPSRGTIPGMLALVPQMLLTHVLYMESKLLQQ
jgi:hypothetical protein